jgi:hypothetical protein
MASHMKDWRLNTTNCIVLAVNCSATDVLPALRDEKLASYCIVIIIIYVLNSTARGQHNQHELKRGKKTNMWTNENNERNKKKTEVISISTQ